MKKKVIGVDVSMEKLDIVIYDGNKHKHSIIDNTPNAFERFLKRFASGSVHIFMEATGVYHIQIAVKAYELGHNIYVVNPLVIKSFSDAMMSRAKTDKVDAKMIAEYGYKCDYRPFTPSSKARLELLELLRDYNYLIEIQTKITNRIHAYKHGLQVSKDAQKVHKSLLKEIKKNIFMLKKAIEQIVVKSYHRIYNKLIAIKGVGIMTIATVIAFYEDFTDFETSKQAISFAGMNPHIRQSGKSLRGRGSISRKGSPEIRRMLYLAAGVARIHNQYFQEFYVRLRSRGKSYKQAIVAVANKLLRQIFAVVKYDREWIPNYASLKEQLGA